ncbi:hypothetical protein MKEN_01072300 [Mycena kentingensis (nom. inval.)]|nr:hypothetical protein MKEN_01072300 [Mycena kentingensis (nom. inval.)]
MDAEFLAYLPDATIPQVPAPPDDYSPFRDSTTAIAIDNGATTLRYGFCTSATPRSSLNVIAKYKERRTNKPLLLFGDGVDVEGGAKIQARAPWEGDILLNFDALENALDCAFIQLGIDASTVDHPVIMSERLCTPMHSRSLTSELLFEQYRVPSATYCVDSVMSFYQNQGPGRDGLVLSFNNASTSVIPILGGKGILSHAKRIPWGASQSADYLLKLLQLKYTNFPTRITAAQTQWMLHNFCEVAPDYTVLLRSLRTLPALQKADRIIQFPFALNLPEEKTAEELEKIAERRREQGKKLQEMAVKLRAEKLAQKESDLEELLALREGKAEDNKREWAYKLQEAGLDDEAELEETIKRLESDLKKARKKDAADGEEVEEPTYPLLDLDEEGLKEKKKQKLLKGSYEARVRAKKEKEREREEREREDKKEEDERRDDLEGWVRKMRGEQENLMTKIKDRERRRAALGDRKSAQAQARMKNIASLAADERIPKKKRKGGGDDTFGANDADWAIYRKINLAAPSDDEEEDMLQLQTIEQKLLAHDPTFTLQETHASISSKRSELISTLRPIYDESDVAGSCRVHLNTERWRVCETYFSPSMAGVDSAGLGEVIQNVLACFSEEDKGKLVKNVFLTGGAAQFKGLIPRLHLTMRPILAPEMPIEIAAATDVTDAWRGMARFAQQSEFAETGVSLAEYEEYGGERIKRWWGGNWN